MAKNHKADPEEQEMWTHWRDEKGYEEALVDYSPNSMRMNETLRLALVQLKSAEALIDQIMESED